MKIYSKCKFITFLKKIFLKLAEPYGKGLEKSADKKEFKIMGKSRKNLEEAVNYYIVEANKGKAIDVKSDQVKDMVAYIKTLKAKDKGVEGKPKKKKPEGC